jgi:hypothetical protein
MGVSARPKPVDGRKISCCCSWAVPPLTAPPDRFANQDAARRAGQTPAAPAPATRCRARSTDRAQLTARVADLETINRRLVAERDARAIEADTANRRVAELEDELSAARESLRRVIKSHNRPQ